MSYQKSSKKEYVQRPPVTGAPPKRFKPGGKDKPKDYENQLAEKLEKSE